MKFLAGLFLVQQVVGFSISNGTPKTTSTTTTTTSALHMATWSDSKAVKDYQDFLTSGKQEIELMPDGASVILYPMEGANAVAESLWEMGMKDDAVITPDQDCPQELSGRTEFPIYICLPPTQLASWISNMPQSYIDRASDFVFFSGGLYFGNIEDVLKEYGLCRDSMTQVLATGFEKTPSGAMKDLTVNLGLDAQGMDKIAGETAACGKWQGAIAQRLERAGVRCSINFYRDWRRKMWERSIIDVCFNLIGAVREEPTTIANVAMYYQQEFSDMVWEVSQQLRGWKGLTLTFGFEERMFGIGEYTGSETPCTLVNEAYEFVWGNPVYTQAPLILDYLWYAKEECGLLQGIDLPPKKNEGDQSSIMRKGNFRADGVV